MVSRVLRLRLYYYLTGPICARIGRSLLAKQEPNPRPGRDVNVAKNFHFLGTCPSSAHHLRAE